MKPILLASVLLASVLLAGCSSGTDSNFTSIVASFHNTGSSAKQVDIRVTGPDGTEILQKRLSAKPGLTNETIPAVARGPYTIFVDYTQTVSQDGNTMSIGETWRHTLADGDCETPTVVVVFSFTFTSKDGQQNWQNRGSAGHCEA